MKYANYVEERAVNIGKYVVATGCTVRQAAKVFNVSKSTVYRDLVYVLPRVSGSLAVDSRIILKYNKSQRAIRGGRATAAKWRMLNE